MVLEGDKFCEVMNIYLDLLGREGYEFIPGPPEEVPSFITPDFGYLYLVDRDHIIEIQSFMDYMITNCQKGDYGEEFTLAKNLMIILKNTIDIKIGIWALDQWFDAMIGASNVYHLFAMEVFHIVNLFGYPQEFDYDGWCG